MLLISFFFDVLDGIYARSYDMVTTFGDYYDHISDIVLYIILITMIIYKCKNKLKLIPFLVIFAIFFYITMMQLGCQEKIYNKEESDTLNFFKKLCPNPPEKTIKFTRFFGCGSSILLLMILIIISGKIS